MDQLFRYFVYASWWVAICASALGMLSYFELTGEYWNTPIAAFIFGSTLVIYNLNMLSGLGSLRQLGTDSERHHWCLDHELSMRVALIIGLVITGISVWFLHWHIWLLMIPLGLLAAGYVLPIFKIQRSAIRIREVGLWKIFLIAIVWSGMTVLLPAVHISGFEGMITFSTWDLTLERAVFILAITIPFDIRDLESDFKKGMKTIPLVLGWKRSVILAEAVLLLFIGMVWLRTGSSDPVFWAYCSTSAITMFLVALATPYQSDMYCSFWLEGTMLLQFIGVLICV